MRYSTRIIALAYLSFAAILLPIEGDAQEYCGLNDYTRAECIYRSPTSPVAGNPQSLESRMIAGDFRLGSFVGPWPDFTSAGAGGAALPSLTGVGLSFMSLSTADFHIEHTELPFSYSRPLADPRYALVFDLPLSFTDITVNGGGTARIYNVSLGAGIRLPLLDNWIVTPAARLGLSSDTGDSVDAYLAGVSVVSNYSTHLGDIDISLGNQISAIKSIGGTSLLFDVSNIILRNGIGISGPTGKRVFDLPVTWEASVVNTQFYGGAVFFDSATDVALSFGTQNSDNGVTWDSMRLGLTYTYTGSDYDGLEVNFGYRF